jgi:hypothetical protein
MGGVLGSQAQKDTAYIHTFGGDRDEEGRDIQLTPDDGFITVGSTSSFGAGQSDIYLLKVDSNIAYQWSKAIGHAGIENGRAVRVHPDGGYLIAGFTNSIGAGGYDGYLVRTDDTGRVIWEKTFGGADWDFFYDMVLTDDKGCIAVGQTHSSGAGNGDAWAARVDNDGNLVWEKTFGGAGEDGANGVKLQHDKKIIFAGHSWDKEYKCSRATLWQLEANGVLNRETFIPNITNTSEYLSDIYLDSTQILVTGTTQRSGLKIDDIISYKLDSNFNIVWASINGGIGKPYNKHDRSYSIIYDKRYVYVLGETTTFGSGESDIYLLRIDPMNGDLLIGATLGNNREEKGSKLIYKSGSFIIVGQTNGFRGEYYDLMILRSDTIKDYTEIPIKNYDQSSVLNNTPFSSYFDLITIYPNPTSRIININNSNDVKFKYNINSLEGRKIKEGYTNNKIYLDGVKTGEYILTLTFRNSHKYFRFIYRSSK